ncbi:MAG: efflux RND transporter permease subunit [Deltaproteobacteria bacterium]|nr:efflux RND transporter permease subunit [Deltaproteobacteria bacterium]
MLIVLGLLSRRLGTESPAGQLPVLTVLTVYPGAGLEDIERDVIALRTRSPDSGLDNVRSFTRSDSMFMVPARHGTDVRDGRHQRRARQDSGGVKGKLLLEGAKIRPSSGVSTSAPCPCSSPSSPPRGVNETREG